jgi:uncharacterized SAM-dependent methyltransferase
VANWVEAAQKGKLDLTLVEHNGKKYVANIARNLSTIEKMVEERRKYRTTKAHKVITPRAEFYSLYSPEQIIDIITNLEVYREIPRQYNYFDVGAKHWSDYADKLYNEESSNFLKDTIDLLDINSTYLDNLFAKYSKVNVIDIGPGNALPVKSLIKRLIDRKVMGRYVAIDISPDMLAIAENNIRKWFGDRISFDADIRDITSERFTDLIVKDYFATGDRNSINLVLFLGGTLANFREQTEALNVIRHSIGSRDILVYTTKLNTPAARTYFDFNNQPEKSKLSPNHRLMTDLLNIDEDSYDVESGFDTKTNMRSISIRLKVSVSIEFAHNDGVWPVELNKNDRVLIWRAWDCTTNASLTQFNAAGFELQQASVTDDGQCLLSIHRVRRAFD